MILLIKPTSACNFCCDFCSIKDLKIKMQRKHVPQQIKDLIKNGQVATQYVDLNGNATMDIQFNPNGSMMAIEGITSPDGRVFGKMGHAERIGNGLYKNVYGDYDIKMFKSAVKYFK